MDLMKVENFKGTLTLDDVTVSLDTDGTPVDNQMWVSRQDKMLYVAYTQQDPFADNPLDDLDGVGNIYTSRRDSATHKEMQAALGLDNYWDRNYNHPAVLKISSRKVLDALCADAGFVAQVINHYEVSTDQDARAVLWDNYLNPETYHRTLLRDDFQNPPVQEDAFDHESWLLARLAGQIGNPFAVPLDVYEHSGVVYSPAGEGPNCHFDTSHGVAVWVPDESQCSELWNETLKPFSGRIETVYGRYDWVPSPDGYDHGDGIKKSYTKVDDGKYVAHLNGEKTSEHATFEEARDALIEALGSNYDPQKGVEAAQAKARELARYACELYTAWCNSECYFVTVETWKLTRDEDDDVFAKRIDDVSGAHFVGSDDTEEAVTEFLREQLPAEAQAH